MLRSPTSDVRRLFLTRCIRMFAYGMLSLVLIPYLAALGLSARKIGLLFALTYAGDILISLWLTTSADRHGRRLTLIAGSLLMIFAAAFFAGVGHFLLLLVAATIGVISPSGYEVGPFLAVEQAALTQVLPDDRRTHVFAWYNLAGSLATAAGSLVGGLLASAAERARFHGANVQRPVVIAYGLLGIALAVYFARLTPAIEVPPATAPRKSAIGLHKSRGVVARLSALFALDAFGGGFVIQSLLVAWFIQRFGLGMAWLGGLFMAANVLAGLSSLWAASLARRFGLINTMVFTHLPSNILLILVPLMPNVWLAIGILLVRFSISQMDVPTRQSYTVAVVDPDERSAAAGITGIARSVGVSFSQLLAGWVLAHASLAAAPFFIAGGCKIVYDLLLYRSFVRHKPPEETRGGGR
ncbi:MAG: MFS transporter [Tepidisphaerales bacterium]